MFLVKKILATIPKRREHLFIHFTTAICDSEHEVNGESLRKFHFLLMLKELINFDNIVKYNYVKNQGRITCFFVIPNFLFLNLYRKDTMED